MKNIQTVQRRDTDNIDKWLIREGWEHVGQVLYKNTDISTRRNYTKNAAIDEMISKDHNISNQNVNLTRDQHIQQMISESLVTIKLDESTTTTTDAIVYRICECKYYETHSCNILTQKQRFERIGVLITDIWRNIWN